MSDSERKRLVWTIRKSLLSLSSDELFQIAKSMGPVPDKDQSMLEVGDEEGCFEYIEAFMYSRPLLDSEDMGMVELLVLKDNVDFVVQSHSNTSHVDVIDNVESQHTFHNPQPIDNITGSAVNTVSNVISSITPTADTSTMVMASNFSSTPAIDLVSPAIANVAQPIPDTELKSMLASYEKLSKKLRQHMTIPSPQPERTPPLTTSLNHSSSQSVQAAHAKQEKVVSLRDLAHLHHREFKIQGGQIGDQGSDISNNNVCRQIDEGLKEQFSEAEIIRSVLKAVKPGDFNDMLMNKDDLTVVELKGFLQSHLGGQNSMELLQELICTKQSDRETPQQFLYRVIGLKQKILLSSKHTGTDVKYNADSPRCLPSHCLPRSGAQT